MLIAVISDIHSNLAALRAVLQDLIKQGAEQIICLGDIVGYFAHPAECLNMLRQLAIPVHFIKGNHELLLRDECWHEDATNEMVLAGILHADKRLSDEQYQFLNNLPRSLVLPELGLAISHDTFTHPGDGRYVMFFGRADDEVECRKQVQALPAQIQVGFLGHLHIPFIYERVIDKRLADYQDNVIDLEFPLSPEARYLINPGSVGQPRDHDNRACYGLLRLEGNQRSFRLRRIYYDVTACIQSIDRMRIADNSVESNLKNRLRGGW